MMCNVPIINVKFMKKNLQFFLCSTWCVLLNCQCYRLFLAREEKDGAHVRIDSVCANMTMFWCALKPRAFVGYVPLCNRMMMHNLADLSDICRHRWRWRLFPAPGSSHPGDENKLLTSKEIPVTKFGSGHNRCLSVTLWSKEQPPPNNFLIALTSLSGQYVSFVHSSQRWERHVLTFPFCVHARMLCFFSWLSFSGQRWLRMESSSRMVCQTIDCAQFHELKWNPAPLLLSILFSWMKDSHHENWGCAISFNHFHWRNEYVHKRLLEWCCMGHTERQAEIGIQWTCSDFSVLYITTPALPHLIGVSWTGHQNLPGKLAFFRSLNFVRKCSKD